MDDFKENVYGSIQEVCLVIFTQLYVLLHLSPLPVTS